jgi:transposase
MNTQYEYLTDLQWGHISEYFNLKRKRKVCLRSVVDAIRYILITGCQWRNLPKEYPKWRAVYYYFDKWNSEGTIDRINMALNRKDRKAEGRKSAPSILCIDTQSVKLAPMIYEERGFNAHKMINGRSRQMLVDVGGRLFGALVHAANIHDGIGGTGLLSEKKIYGRRLKKIMGDASYKGAFAEKAEKCKLEFECSSRPETTKGFVPLKKRWVVERTIAWTNFFRRLVKDYEHTTKSAKYWLFWGNIQVILNRTTSYTIV